MAKSNKGSDRRAVVEQMRREQKRKERTRSIAIVATCAVVALGLVGVAVFAAVSSGEDLPKGSLSSLGVPASDAGCQDRVTKPAAGNSDHKSEGTQISYPDAPPAFGPHYPVTAPFARKFYTAEDRPELEYLVHNLEHGYNILWYDSTIAKDEKALAVVKAIANKFNGNSFKDKFIAAPWTGDDGKGFPGGAHVAITHWSLGGTHGNPKQQTGVWQYCGAPSGEAVAEFVKDYPFTDSAEPQAG